MKIQVFAKVALFALDGKVLLLKRSGTDDRRASEWDLAGGGIEPGEDLAAGAAREVLEETGIVIDPIQLQLVYAATAPFNSTDSNTRLLFIGETNTKEVTLSHEHDEYRWVNIDTAIADFPHPVYSLGLAYARDNGLFKQISS